MTGVRDQLRQVDLTTTPKPPASTTSAPTAPAPAAGTGTGTTGTRRRKTRDQEPAPAPAPETPAVPGTGKPAQRKRRPAAAVKPEPVVQQEEKRLGVLGGEHPENYLLRVVGREELNKVGRPLNLGSPPEYLRRVLTEHCDRDTLPMRTLMFALLDVYAREQGWLPDETD